MIFFQRTFSLTDILTYTDSGTKDLTLNLKEHPFEPRKKNNCQSSCWRHREVRSSRALGGGDFQGAIFSAVSLSKGVKDFFQHSGYEATYGRFVLEPTLLQDYICRIAVSAEAARMGVAKLESVAETKLIDFNGARLTFDLSIP